MTDRKLGICVATKPHVDINRLVRCIETCVYNNVDYFILDLKDLLSENNLLDESNLVDLENLFSSFSAVEPDGAEDETEEAFDGDADE